MSVAIFTGGEESVLRDAVSAHVDELVGDGDRSLMVDDFDDPEYELAELIAAANTLPLLTGSRVVVGRDVGRFTADELKPLVAYLQAPSDTTALVLVAGGGRLPKALTDAAAAAGGTTVNTKPPARPRDRQQWIDEQASAHGVSLSRDAAARIGEHLGEDVGVLGGLLETLASAFGGRQRLDVDDVEPFLGERGGVPPWDLTDAVDRGRTDQALSLLQRMTGAGGRHPLQVMAILHGHYARLARLDGSGATSEAEAAATLGIKPGFPARKALDQYRSLGGANVRRAVEMLATADLDLRGARELPEQLVLEILVARLSRLAA